MENKKFDLRLSDAIQEWLEVYKKNTVKASTYDRLVISLRMLERYPISSLTPQEVEAKDIQKYLNLLVDDGYSASTVKKQFTLLTAYFRHCFAQGEVEFPVYMNVNLPKAAPKKVRSDHAEAYNVADQQKLMKEILKLDSLGYGVAGLMLETGLRVGEAMSLSWSDIDWDRRALTVHKTLVRLSARRGVTYVQNSPKSTSSNRTIPLSNNAIELLRRLLNLKDDQSEFVFSSARNPTMPISYFSVKRSVIKLCNKANVEYRGTHTFRHTFATNCYHRGCDVKILSKLLGHADVGITYNTYIHLYGDALEEMRKVLG